MRSMGVLPNIGFSESVHFAAAMSSGSCLYVYDEQGTMVDQLNIWGKQSFQWEPADLPAGMYLLYAASDGLRLPEDPAAK